MTAALRFDPIRLRRMRAVAQGGRAFPRRGNRPPGTFDPHKPNRDDTECRNFPARSAGASGSHDRSGVGQKHGGASNAQFLSEPLGERCASMRRHYFFVATQSLPSCRRARRPCGKIPARRCLRGWLVRIEGAGGDSSSRKGAHSLRTARIRAAGDRIETEGCSHLRSRLLCRQIGCWCQREATSATIHRRLWRLPACRARRPSSFRNRNRPPRQRRAAK